MQPAHRTLTIDQVRTEETGDVIELRRVELESGALRTVMVVPEGGAVLTSRDAATLARALLQAGGY